MIAEYKPGRTLRSMDSGQIVELEFRPNRVKQHLSVPLHRNGTDHQQKVESVGIKCE